MIEKGLPHRDVRRPNQKVATSWVRGESGASGRPINSLLGWLFLRMVGPQFTPLQAPNRARIRGAIDGGAIKLIKRVRGIWFHRE